MGAKQEPANLETVRADLRERLAYIEDQIAPLQREADEIRKMLGEEAAKPSIKRSAKSQELRLELYEAVESRPGLSGTEYAADVGVPPPTATRLLKGLEEEGIVRHEGQRRGTRWYITSKLPNGYRGSSSGA